MREIRRGSEASHSGPIAGRQGHFELLSVALAAARYSALSVKWRRSPFRRKRGRIRRRGVLARATQIGASRSSAAHVFPLVHGGFAGVWSSRCGPFKNPQCRNFGMNDTFC